jgi:hypothetical protein
MMVSHIPAAHRSCVGCERREGAGPGRRSPHGQRPRRFKEKCPRGDRLHTHTAGAGVMKARACDLRKAATTDTAIAGSACHPL